MGSMANFLTHPVLRGEFDDIAAVVRKGGTVKQDTAALPGNPIWVEFAHSMTSMARMSARDHRADGRGARQAHEGSGYCAESWTVRHHCGDAQSGCSKFIAVDWENVLQVAAENAAAAGIADRYRTIPGSAFAVEFGDGYDLVLITNFFHHFDPPTNVKFLKKVRAAMKPGGTVATAEFVPNEDRVSPPQTRVVQSGHARRDGSG